MQGVDTKLYDWTTAVDHSEFMDDIRQVGKFIYSTFTRDDFDSIKRYPEYYDEFMITRIRWCDEYVTADMTEWNDFVNVFASDEYEGLPVHDFACDVDSYMSQLYGHLWLEIGEDYNEGNKVSR